MSDFPRFSWRHCSNRFTVIKCPECELGLSVCVGGNGETIFEEFERVHPKHCPKRHAQPCGPPEE